MGNLTILETRGNLHFCVGPGLDPACGSRAEIVGFQYKAGGAIGVRQDHRDRLCTSCMEKVGAAFTREPEEGEDG